MTLIINILIFYHSMDSDAIFSVFTHDENLKIQVTWVIFLLRAHITEVFYVFYLLPDLPCQPIFIQGHHASAVSVLHGQEIQ